MKFLGYPMRKEGLKKNLIFRRLIENKRGREKQDIAFLTTLCKWMGEQVVNIAKRQILLRSTKDMK